MSSTPATPAATPATPAASDPAPAATPKSALPSADQIKAIVAESQRLAQQNAEFQAQLNFYEQQHAAKMTPVVKALTDHYAGDPDLNDDERAHLTAYAAELASKPSTAGIVAYNHRMIEKLSAAQAQLAEHAKAREASNAATSEWSTVLQEALSGAQANAAPLPFSSGQPPMIRQHAAGARMAPVPATFPPVDRDLAKKLEERIKARMYEYEGRKQPDAKRVPPSQ